MTTYAVRNKATGQEITRYAAQQPVEQIDDLAVQTVERDANDEIVSITTRYS